MIQESKPSVATIVDDEDNDAPEVFFANDSTIQKLKELHDTILPEAKPKKSKKQSSKSNTQQSNIDEFVGLDDSVLSFVDNLASIKHVGVESVADEEPKKVITIDSKTVRSRKM